MLVYMYAYTIRYKYPDVEEATSRRQYDLRHNTAYLYKCVRGIRTPSISIYE